MFDKLKHHSGDKQAEAAHPAQQPAQHHQPATATAGDMASQSAIDQPSRQGTNQTTLSDEAVPDFDPSSVSYSTGLQSYRRS